MLDVHGNPVGRRPAPALLQNAECIYDSSPNANADSQCSDQRSDGAAPGRSISLSTRTWSVLAFDAPTLGFFEQMIARMAASFVSSGSSHSKPRAFALSATAATVAVEHPHENAMLRTLTPHGFDRIPNCGAKPLSDGNRKAAVA